MGVNSGVSDQVQVLKETAFGDGGAAGEKVFGVTQNFEWNADASVQQSWGLEDDGPGATVNVDGVTQVSGTHTYQPTDGREFEGIIGSLTDGTGTFSLSTAKTLPSYSVKVVDDEENTNYLIIKGLKYTSYTVTMERGEIVSVEASWQAQTIEDTASFTPTVASKKPFTFLDGVFSIGGTNKANVDNITVEIARNNVPRRFIESTSTGDRRLITDIVEGVLNPTFSGEIAAERSVLEEIWGGSGSFQDTRSDKTISLKMDRDSTQVFTLDLTGGRFTTVGRPLEKEQEVALQSFEGVALDVSGTGTYS